MDKTRIFQIVNEEVDKMFVKAQKNSSKIEKDLESLRKKLYKEEEMTVEGLNGAEPKIKEKRIALSVVSEILDVPINELMLYFLNCVKTKNERSLVEMRLGHCYFYNV